jgi:DNA-directed RNA polymerase specialized sigma24 family protein
MGNDIKLGKIPEERAATPDEIRAAIDALSKTDWYRLRKFADYHIFLLGEKAGDRRGDDLLNEAFKRLLQRSRKWDKSKVGFLGFLYGAMESIADSWQRKKASPTEAPALASSLVTENDEGESSDPAEEFESTAANPAQMLVYKETLGQIDALFADDQEVRMVIEALGDGYDPPGIRGLWEFSQKQYNAIVVRMRRHVERTGITDPTRGRRHVQ